MSYAAKSSAKRAALRQFGKSTREGYDWELIPLTPDHDGKRRWDYQPGSKYDDSTVLQSPSAGADWETLIGNGGKGTKNARAEDNSGSLSN